MESMLRSIAQLYHRLDDHMKEIIRGATTAFTLKTLGALLAFCLNVMLARILGVDGTGAFFLALTVSTIASVISRLGLDNALLRFTAANVAIGDWVAVKGVYQKAIPLALIASGTLTVLTCLTTPWLAVGVFEKPELVNPMRWMALVITPLTMLMLYGELLKGCKRISVSQVIQNVGLPGLSILGLLVLGRIWGVLGAVWAYTLAALGTALIGYLAWIGTTPEIRGLKGEFSAGELFRSSLPLYIVSITDIVINRTPMVLLGVWGTSGDLGIFGVATRTAMLTSFVLIAVNSIAAPVFAGLYRKGDIEGLGRVARQSTKLMILIAAPVLALFIYKPHWVMVLFGPAFIEGAICLRILAVGQFVNVAAGSVGYLLIMSGNERLLRNNMMISAFLNAFLCILIIPRYGLIGAAISTSVTLIFTNIMSAYFVWVRLKIMPTPLVSCLIH